MSKGISQRAKRRREHLTPDEVKKFLAAAKTSSRNPERDYAAMLLMFRHGLRVSELCEMKLNDINLKTKNFYVPRYKDCDDACHDLYPGESFALKAWLVERGRMNPPESCDWLFISERRRRLCRGTIHLAVRLIAQAAGLGHLEVHPHMLRHSCGYALINQGTDIRTIQGYLGHRFISSTVRYTKLDKNRFKGLFR
jgi:type 1 fimbriae regulatory protein FimB